MIEYYNWEELDINWEAANMEWQAAVYSLPEPVVPIEVPEQKSAIQWTWPSSIVTKAPSSVKFLSKKNREMVKTNLKYLSNLKLEKSFFSTPLKISILKNVSILILDLFFKEILSDNKNLLKDSTTKKILSFTSSEIADDSISETLLSCYNESVNNEIPQIDENLNVQDILNTITKLNDIDRKIHYKKIERLQSLIKNNENKIESYKFLFQHIIDSIRDLLTKTEHPSKYRTKYIQRLIRNTYGLMKSEYEDLRENAKREYEKIISALKRLDDILIAITLITAIYITNRLKLTKKSRESLKELAVDSVCLDVLEPFDVSVNKTPFEINLNCPTVIDDVLVPHVPISEKMDNISCEVSQNSEIIVEPSIKEDLVTMAMIKNNRKKDELKSTITIDTFVDQKTSIAILSDASIFVYAPLEGYVDEINSDSIVLRDIHEPDEDYLTSQINLLNEKFERLNNIKLFLKYYSIECLYPSMLATAIVDDSSTYDKYSGIEKQWKDIKKEFEKIDKEYEKQVKKLAGKDNVETHAKDETLYKIKEELETQEEIFYKYVKLLNEKALNISKKTKAKSNEYELFEFYTLDLGMLFNSIENPNKLEIEFRDVINEFIRRRYIVDGYKKNKLEKKIDDYIQEIEKGITTGNWFKKAQTIYNAKKSFTELKDWLTGLANENNKLDGNEKIFAVNRVMFLFKLYLETDSIVQKYNILKKETTPIKETIKEGNYITKFLADLQKDYIQIPLEIDQILKIVDNFSLFSTYSIIEYKGKQTRLYSIAESRNCESQETDPYINPKSDYGYSDIQYWFKYCAYATLTSVANPAFGWSTGWIFPAPILFPVVYIPIKPISTKFGFIVVGLSICGIYVFPWTLFVNLSSKYAIPFLDPTVLLKNEIKALKREISERLVDLKQSRIKPLLERVNIEIDDTDQEIKTLKDYLKESKEYKPERYMRGKTGEFEVSDIGEGLKENKDYVKQYKEWYAKEAETRESLITSQVKLWKLETKGAILQEAYNKGAVAGSVGVEAIDKSQTFINEQLDKLDLMIENIDQIIAVLPIAISPETANFGITIKNPKPLIKIAGELDENINYNVLDKITDKFRLKNSDFLSSNYNAAISKSAINHKLYRKALSASMMSIMIKDAFPSYNLLKPTNIPWVTFLYKDFVNTGSRTYGWPGYLPLPI